MKTSLMVASTWLGDYQGRPSARRESDKTRNVGVLIRMSYMRAYLIFSSAKSSTVADPIKL